MIERNSEFLDLIHFSVPERIEPVKGDPIAYLTLRESQLIEELATVRRILANLQGFEPTITYTLYEK